MPLKLWYHCPCSDIAWSGLVCVFKIHFVRHSMPCYVLFLDTQSCPTVCDPMDCIFPGSSVHGISPGKNTGVGCHSFLWVSSPPRDWTQVSRIASGFFTIWVTRSIYINIYIPTCVWVCIWLPRCLSGKESVCQAEDMGLISGLGRSPGGGNGYPLQDSHLGNPMDREAWKAIVHGVARVRHNLNHHIVDFPCCVSFRYTANGLSNPYASIYSFSNSVPIWLLQNIEQSRD